MPKISPNMPLPQCIDIQDDHVEVMIEGAVIRLDRQSSLSVPAEVSAYIPRVEVRIRKYENGQLISEEERIYNSITVVHAPHHPAEHQVGEPETHPSPLPPSANTGPGTHPGAPVSPGPPQKFKPPQIPSAPEPHPPPSGSPHPKIKFNSKPTEI